MFTPSQNKPWFSRVCGTSLLKTLWKKEKLLETSNISLSVSVFCPFGGLPGIFIGFGIVVCERLDFGRVKKNLPFGKGLRKILVFFMIYRRCTNMLFCKCTMTEQGRFRSVMPLPKQQSLDPSKLKEFADDNFQGDENGGKFSKRVENTVGKRRNCSLRAISPFPTVFSKDLYFRHVKTRACFWKGSKTCGLAPSHQINPFPDKPRFLRVCSTRLLKTLWEKEKLLVMSNFSFSHCFLPCLKNFVIFIRLVIVVCKHFQFGRI